jgi:beta-glucanase (GH16 family)
MKNRLPTRSSLLAAIALAAANPAFGQLIWSEEFDNGTALDESVWSYDLGANGWGNRELQNYTDNPENVRIEDGNLVITAVRSQEGFSFTSARVRTEDKLTVKYGTIEARIKVPDLADGLWPAFWTLGNNFSRVGWPYCGELDIMEMGNSQAISSGVINRRVGSTAHWDNDGNYANFGQHIDAATDLNDDFHLYRMEWTPTSVTTYLDGEQVWAFDIDPAVCTSCTEFHQPHFMILNLAVGGTYTGLLNAAQISADMPAEMLIDYIRIYDNGFTELGGTSVGNNAVLGQEYSGSWYNPDQSGHGFSMEFGEVQGTPVALVYWYTYDLDGKPIFLIGQGTQTADGVDLDVISPYGMQYGMFDPGTVVRENAGTARLDFSDANNAVFSYVPSEFSQTAWGHSAIESLPLIKLFAIPLPPGQGATR